MPKPICVAMVGHAEVGKNYLADSFQRYLQLNHDVTAINIAFAEPLKALVHDLYPELPTDKAIIEVREKYQSVGSALRHYLGDAVFINALHDSIYSYEYPFFHIVTDARYANEVDYILNDNPLNHVIHITREGVGPKNLHRSELDFLQIILPTGRYYNDRIHHYDNHDGSDPTPLFNTITNHMFKDKDK